jgi:diguanylate cyclase
MMMTIYYLVAMLNKISRIKNLYIVFHFLLDTFIIISVAVMASWNYLIYPRLQVAATSESLLYNIVSVGYPIGDLGLLLGVFMLCLYPGELLSKKGMCCFVSGLSILIFADSAYVYLGATNNDTVSNLIGPVWALSILVLGLVGSYSKDKNEEVDIDKKCL